MGIAIMISKPDEAARALTRIRRLLLAQKAAGSRKRSWLPSAKAMFLAEKDQDLEIVAEVLRELTTRLESARAEVILGIAPTKPKARSR